MVKIPTRGREMEIPQYLDELTPDQYRFFLRLYLGFVNGLLDGGEIRHRWLSHLVGLTDYRILLPEYVAELERVFPELDFFFDSDGSPLLLTSSNLLPEEGGWKGPGDWLQGVSFGQFIEVLTMLEQMAEADGEMTEEISRRVARILYNIPEDSEVPPLLLIHAPRLVANIWRIIQEGSVPINGRMIDFRIIFKSDGSTREADDKTGWTGITFEIAEKGLFGTMKDVEQADFWTVLLYLYKCKFEYINEKNKQS